MEPVGNQERRRRTEEAYGSRVWGLVQETERRVDTARVLTRCSPSNLKNGVFIDVYPTKIRFRESARRARDVQPSRRQNEGLYRRQEGWGSLQTRMNIAIGGTGGKCPN